MTDDEQAGGAGWSVRKMRKGWVWGAHQKSLGQWSSRVGEQQHLGVPFLACAPEDTKWSWGMSTDQEARPWKKDGPCLGGYLDTYTHRDFKAL